MRKLKPPYSHEKIRRFCVILFFVYVAYLTYVLFLSPGFGRTAGVAREYNLIPFDTIRRYIRYRSYVGNNNFIINIIGNIVAFLPTGFFVPLIFESRRKVLAVIFISALLSLCAEILQYLTNVGSFDVDDIMLNALGGFIGYLLFRIIHGVYYLIFSKYKKEGQ